MYQRQSSLNCVHQGCSSSAQTHVYCRYLLSQPQRNAGTLQSCRTIGKKGQETDAATNFPIAEMVFDQRDVSEIAGALLVERIEADISKVILHLHHSAPARSQHLVSLPVLTGCSTPALVSWHIYIRFPLHFSSCCTISTQCYKLVHHKHQLDYRDCCI